MKNLKEPCYLCGSCTDRTKFRDHIPPENFFPEPRPSNLITVTCCEKCNKDASMDDEAFRAWFAGARGASPAAKHLWEKKVIYGVYRRSQKFREFTISLVREGTVETLDGPVVMRGIEFPRERTNRFMTRIVKGLLRHHHPDYDYSAETFTVRHLAISKHNEELFKPFHFQSEYAERGEGVVCYRWKVDFAKREGLWLITFFASTNFLVVHFRLPPAHGPSPTS